MPSLELGTNIISKAKAARKVLSLAIVCFSVFLSSCASTTVVHNNRTDLQLHSISRSAKVVIVPFLNNTETVRAGHRAEAMLANLLRSDGATNLVIFPRKQDCDHFADCPSAHDVYISALKWAVTHNASYIVTGTINEWRYKVGLDGEPSVSITLRVLLAPDKSLLSLADDKTKNAKLNMALTAEKTVWSAVGSKTGGSRSGLGGTAQRLLMEMTSGLKWH